MHKDYIKFDRKQKENTKRAGRQKTSFPKGQIENVDLYKPVLDKLMITHERCVKCNFVALFICKSYFRAIRFTSEDFFKTEILDLTLVSCKSANSGFPFLVPP